MPEECGGEGRPQVLRPVDAGCAVAVQDPADADGRARRLDDREPDAVVSRASHGGLERKALLDDRSVRPGRHCGRRRELTLGK
eukprot:4452896-Prymnesium_polylepis.1